MRLVLAVAAVLLVGFGVTVGHYNLFVMPSSFGIGVASGSLIAALFCIVEFIRR
jgi:uncharacterized transporter YbjL